MLLTSNVSAETIKRSSAIGFTPIRDEHTYEKMRDIILDEAKRAFRPEFLNHLDDIIVFRSLTKPDLIQILDLEISKVVQRLKGRNIQLQLDDTAKDQGRNLHSVAASRQSAAIPKRREFGAL